MSIKVIIIHLLRPHWPTYLVQGHYELAITLSYSWPGSSLIRKCIMVLELWNFVLFWFAWFRIVNRNIYYYFEDQLLRTVTKRDMLLIYHGAQCQNECAILFLKPLLARYLLSRPTILFQYAGKHDIFKIPTQSVQALREGKAWRTVFVLKKTQYK